MNSKINLERESIAGRIAEFLKLHPPFNLLKEHDLTTIANQTLIEYFDDNNPVFGIGETLHEHIYLIRKGVVKIVGQNETLIDQCSEGELFGARAFMSSETYQASAFAAPEALLIKMPITSMREVIAKDARIMEYFFGDFSSGVALRKRKLSQINQQIKNLESKELAPSIPLKSFKAPITCTENTSIKEAAQIMAKHKIGSIIISNNQNHPIGIVTNSDLRDKVATGFFEINKPITTIMTSPVIAVEPNFTIEQYVIEMISNNCHHLCVTQNGTNNEPIVGIITDHDLLVNMGNNPSVLLKELRSSKTLQEQQVIVSQFDNHIKSLVESDHSILNIAQLSNTFNKKLLEKTINQVLQENNFEFDSSQFCWLALGSTARAEQIIRTDFDSALVFVDELEHKKDQLIKMTDLVFERLILLGYKTDKAGIQANNPDWIKSLGQWKSNFAKWIDIPEEKALLNATIFFDLMPFFGNNSLAIEMQKTIADCIKRNKRYSAFLAINALQNPPPLGFFKNLVLEKKGDHSQTFDIKARAMMPLADAARLLALENNLLFPSNTLIRYQNLAKYNAINSAKYEDCAVAYEIFMRLRAREGIKNSNHGRYIDPSSLTSLEKQLLKNAFEPISKIQHEIKPL